MARDLAIEAVVREFYERYPERMERLMKRLAEASDQRKHECTHGWRNPPSVYEKDRSET